MSLSPLAQAISNRTLWATASEIAYGGGSHQKYKMSTPSALFRPALDESPLNFSKLHS